MTTDTTSETAAPSLVTLLTNLPVNGCHVFAERLDGNEATKEVITDTRLRLRNLAASAVSRAKTKTGFTFTVENGEFATRSLDNIICVCATRMS